MLDQSEIAIIHQGKPSYALESRLRQHPLGEALASLADEEGTTVANFIVEGIVRVLDDRDELEGVLAGIPTSVSHLEQREALSVNKGVDNTPLTTTQAADLMGMSRPMLIKLLDKGELPHYLVGSHRRISQADVNAYIEKRRAESLGRQKTT